MEFIVVGILIHHVVNLTINAYFVVSVAAVSGETIHLHLLPDRQSNLLGCFFDLTRVGKHRPHRFSPDYFVAFCYSSFVVEMLFCACKVIFSLRNL